ncbi:hypothetical protein [Legionella sp. W05-934-2]|uniref:hypothetical protein n=1 Tax=Legionella sp. W05-934-2 TaxID=1198649 RepID=UPI003461C5AE
MGRESDSSSIPHITSDMSSESDEMIRDDSSQVDEDEDYTTSTPYADFIDGILANPTPEAKKNFFLALDNYYDPTIQQAFKDNYGNYIRDKPIPISEKDSTIVASMKHLYNALYYADSAGKQTSKFYQGKDYVYAVTEIFKIDPSVLEDLSGTFSELYNNASMLSPSAAEAGAQIYDHLPKKAQRAADLTFNIDHHSSIPASQQFANVLTRQAANIPDNMADNSSNIAADAQVLSNALPIRDFKKDAKGYYTHDKNESTAQCNEKALLNILHATYELSTNQATSARVSRTSQLRLVNSIRCELGKLDIKALKSELGGDALNSVINTLRDVDANLCQVYELSDLFEDQTRVKNGVFSSQVTSAHDELQTLADEVGVALPGNATHYLPERIYTRQLHIEALQGDRDRLQKEQKRVKYCLNFLEKHDKIESLSTNGAKYLLDNIDYLKLDPDLEKSFRGALEAKIQQDDPNNKGAVKKLGYYDTAIGIAGKKTGISLVAQVLSEAKKTDARYSATIETTQQQSQAIQTRIDEMKAQLDRVPDNIEEKRQALQRKIEKEQADIQPLEALRNAFSGIKKSNLKMSKLPDNALDELEKNYNRLDISDELKGELGSYFEARRNNTGDSPVYADKLDKKFLPKLVEQIDKQIQAHQRSINHYSSQNDSLNQIEMNLGQGMVHVPNVRFTDTNVAKNVNVQKSLARQIGATRKDFLQKMDGTFDDEVMKEFKDSNGHLITDDAFDTSKPQSANVRACQQVLNFLYYAEYALSKENYDPRKYLVAGYSAAGVVKDAALDVGYAKWENETNYEFTPQAIEELKNSINLIYGNSGEALKNFKSTLNTVKPYLPESLQSTIDSLFEPSIQTDIAKAKDSKTTGEKVQKKVDDISSTDVTGKFQQIIKAAKELENPTKAIKPGAITKANIQLSKAYDSILKGIPPDKIRLDKQGNVKISKDDSASIKTAKSILNIINSTSGIVDALDSESYHQTKLQDCFTILNSIDGIITHLPKIDISETTKEAHDAIVVVLKEVDQELSDLASYIDLVRDEGMLKEPLTISINGKTYNVDSNFDSLCATYNSIAKSYGLATAAGNEPPYYTAQRLAVRKAHREMIVQEIARIENSDAKSTYARKRQESTLIGLKRQLNVLDKRINTLQDGCERQLVQLNDAIDSDAQMLKQNPNDGTIKQQLATHEIQRQRIYRALGRDIPPEHQTVISDQTSQETAKQLITDVTEPNYEYRQDAIDARQNPKAPPPIPGISDLEAPRSPPPIPARSDLGEQRSPPPVPARSDLEAPKTPPTIPARSDLGETRSAPTIPTLKEFGELSAISSNDSASLFDDLSMMSDGRLSSDSSLSDDELEEMDDPFAESEDVSEPELGSQSASESASEFESEPEPEPIKDAQAEIFSNGTSVHDLLGQLKGSLDGMDDCFECKAANDTLNGDLEEEEESGQDSNSDSFQGSK